MCRLSSTTKRLPTRRPSSPGSSAAADPEWLAKMVEVVRRTRTIPICASGRPCAERSTPPSRRAGPAAWLSATAFDVGLDGAIVALSGRVRLREGCPHAEEVVTELWDAVFGGRVGCGGKSNAPTGACTDPNRPRRADADAAIAESRRRTSSRASSRRNPRFEQVSPEVGELDEAAFEEGLARIPTRRWPARRPRRRDRSTPARTGAPSGGATVLGPRPRGPSARRGVGKIVELPYHPDGGDLDLDASFGDHRSRRRRRAINADRLRIRS